jgi:hypothetical protein
VPCDDGDSAAGATSRRTQAWSPRRRARRSIKRSKRSKASRLGGSAFTRPKIRGQFHLNACMLRMCSKMTPGKNTAHLQTYRHHV